MSKGTLSLCGNYDLVNADENYEIGGKRIGVYQTSEYS